MTVGFCLSGTFSKQKSHTKKSFLYFLKNIFLYSRMDTVKKQKFLQLFILQDRSWLSCSTKKYSPILWDHCWYSLPGALSKPKLKTKKHFSWKISNIFWKQIFLFFEMNAEQAWNKRISHTLGWLLIKHGAKDFIITWDDCWFSLPNNLFKIKLEIKK